MEFDIHQLTLVLNKISSKNIKTPMS